MQVFIQMIILQSRVQATKVEMPGLGVIGYVANSHFTVLGDSMSAGRIYDKIGDTARGKVMYVLPQGVLCELLGEECKLTEDEFVEKMKEYGLDK